MTPLNEFLNELNSLARSEGLSNEETKKRLLILADKMDRAGVPNLEKLAYRAMSLIDEFPNNKKDVFALISAVASEDWLKVGDIAKPLLDIKDLRELTKNVGLKTTL